MPRVVIFLTERPHSWGPRAGHANPLGWPHPRHKGSPTGVGNYNAGLSAVAGGRHGGPMNALVLCGGRGTRLRPLTYTLPKQLIPIANRPVVHYVMDQLAAARIRDIGVIVAPETAGQIREALQDNPWGFALTYIQQDQPLGIAHTVRIARNFLNAAPFVLYLGDNLVGGGLHTMIQRFHERQADAIVLLREVADPRPFGVAVVDGDGRLTRLVEKPQQPPSNLALAGVYIFSSAIHEAVDRIHPSWRGELEITDAIQHLLDSGRQVIGERLQTWWLDCGKKDDLLEANRVVLDEWLQREITGEVDAVSRLSGRVRIEAGAVVQRSEVRGPVLIASGSRIEDSFIGPYTSIGQNCTISRSSLEHCVLLDEARIEGVRRLEDSVLGRHAVVRSNPARHEALRLLVGDESEVVL